MAEHGINTTLAAFLTRWVNLLYMQVVVLYVCVLLKCFHKQICMQPYQMFKTWPEACWVEMFMLLTSLNSFVYTDRQRLECLCVCVVTAEKQCVCFQVFVIVERVFV